MYPRYPQQKYLATNSTQGSFTITAGRKALVKSGGQVFLSGSTVHRVVPLSGARGAAFQFFGTDAADETFTDVKVWGATFANYSGATSPLSDFEEADYADMNLIGATGLVTLSTATGAAAGDLVDPAEFIADTIAGWALAGLGTPAEPAYGLGTADEYSPTGNVPASLIVPNFGPLIHAFVIEFDLGTAESANALFTLTD